MPFGSFKGNATLVDSILNGTISGSAVGTANGLATLDGTGVLTLSQRFLDALTASTNNRVGVGSSSNGTDNNVFGAGGFSSMTSGARNTGMGHQILQSITNQNDNSSFGYRSLRNNTVSELTAFGSYALTSNTTSTKNTGIGFQALRNNTTSIGGNTAIGHNSMLTNVSGAFNTAIGVDTIRSSSSGSSNIALGYYALRSNTVPMQNVAIGHGSMQNGVSGQNNVGIGHNSLQSTTSDQQVALGAYSLQFNTTGTNNTATGYRTLRANVSGTDNTGIGFSSLIASTGSRNSANGSLSLGSNVGGNDNVAFGYNALFGNVGGSQNVGLGSGSLANTVGQSGNIAVGHDANSTAITVNDTISIGRNSRASGANSISLGGDLTNPSVVSGTSAVGIGRNVTVTSTNGVAIGNNATVTSNNYVQLGESTNSGTLARLQFRSQIIGDESWISAGTFTAAIDASGNILKTAVPVGGSGEANTASNVGVGGVGLFKQKTGVNLDFRNVNAASSKITVVLDAPNNEVDLDVVDANINHNSLLNYVANQHVDHSTVSISSGVGLTGGGDITTSRTLSLDINGLTTEPLPVVGDFIPFYDVSATAQRKMTITSLQTLIGGEANTASNVGVGGVGLFKQKTGVDLEFRNVNAASSKISIALDAPNNEVDIDVVEANVNHNALLNYVANQHVDHSTVSISAGVGLTGGGDITTSRTLSLDINGLTTEPTPVLGDFIPFYDVSATAQRKMTITSLGALIGGGGGEANTASNVGVGGVGLFKQKTGVDLEFRNVNTASSKVTVTLDAPNNEVDIDIVEANINHNSLLNYVANQHVDHSAVSISAGQGLTGGGDITTSRTLALDINGLTTEPTPVLADFIPFYDVSATTQRKMTITSLGALIGGGGGEANTASNVGVGGVGLFKQKTGVDLEFRNINTASSKISVALDAPNNEVDIDVVEANVNHNALLNYVANQHVDHSTVSISAGQGLTGGGDITANRTLALDINGLTAEPAPAPGDFVPIYDISVATQRKVTLSSLLSTPDIENISGAAGAAGVNPSVTVSRTFVSTTSAGADVTGTLADGTINGMLKYIVATSLIAKYVLTITNAVQASGAALSTLTFDNSGNTVQLIWNTTVGKWFLANTGATVA